MRQWSGTHDGSLPIGNGLTTVRNVSFHRDGLCSRRPQLQDRYDLDAVVISGLTHPLGGSFLVAADGAGALNGVDLPTGTSTALASGLDDDIPGTLTNHQAKLYYNNDFDDPRRMERGDLAAVIAGIDAPASAPSVSSFSSLQYTGVSVTLSAVSVSGSGFPTRLIGKTIQFVTSSGAPLSRVVDSVSSAGTSLNLTATWSAATATAVSFTESFTASITAGTHRFRYRYRDAKTGYLSNPSPETESTTSQYFARATVVASADSKVTDVILEATTADGAVFYQVSESDNASGTIDYDILDVELENNIDIDAIYGSFGHEPPPYVEIMCEHRGRMFGWKRSLRTRTGCTVASGVDTISGTGFPTTGAWDGRLLTVNSEKTTNIISSTTSTVITLASAYTGSASGSANSISVFHPQPDMLYWSRAGFPESWKPSTWARRVLQGGADEPSAMFSAYDTLWLCGQHSIRTFDYTADPAAARLSAIPTEMGVYNQQCVVQADGRTFGFGQAGVFELQGRVPTRISDDIEIQLAELIDTAQFADFHGCYDPRERSVTWYFTRTGDTVPKDGICYFVESGQWQFVSYRQPIRASTTYGSASYPFRPYLADSNGYVWRVGDDRPADCLPSSLSSGVLTTASANSTTVINIVESLPTGAADCKGAMLYWPAAAEARVITANTANTVTVDPAFSAAPGTGVVLYMGSIDVHLKSDWWAARSPQHKKRPPYLAIEHLSEGTAPEVYASVYQDLSATAAQWTTDAGDSRLLGVTATSATVRTVDLGATESAGILYSELPDKYCKYWRWTLTQDRPAGDFALMDCQFLVLNRGDVDEDIKPV